MTTPKRILLPFARSPVTLEIARHLKRGGHTVFTADTVRFPVTRLSNTVAEYVKIPSPRFDPDGFIDFLVKFAKDRKIDFIIPIWEEIALISKFKHKFPKTCTIFCSNFELYHDLHNKWKFQALLKSLDIPSLKTELINDVSELREYNFNTPFAFKACYSRASQRVIKVNPGSIPEVKIEKHNLWIAQEWCEGNRYCTYSICHHGKVHAHAVYPVNYAIDGNSCLTYESISHPHIFDWVKNLIQKLNFTGQIAFDFVQNQEGQLFAIECNPRATSGVHLFTYDQHLDRAFLGTNEHTIFSKIGSKRQFAVGMCLYGWKANAKPGNRPKNFVKDLFSYKDVLFDKHDLKPFIYNPLVLGYYWLDSLRYKIPLPAYFTYDYDWDGDLYTS